MPEGHVDTDEADGLPEDQYENEVERGQAEADPLEDES